MCASLGANLSGHAMLLLDMLILLFAVSSQAASRARVHYNQIKGTSLALRLVLAFRWVRKGSAPRFVKGRSYAAFAD